MPHSESAVAEAAPPPPPDVLVFTDAAAGKVGELIREEANPNLKLRVFVSGGGCSGFQYGFTFDEKIEEGDFCVEKRGVQLLVDPMSAQYLMGAEIDYKEDLAGRAIRHTQPQRQDHLRVRILILGVATTPKDDS